MSINGDVHWHEGLFLQPHHLQTMQRGLNERWMDERRLTWAYPYGLVDSKLSADVLENMLVRFERLHVVMPSGLDVDAPRNAELPSLDIKEAFESGRGAVTVSIGVPLWYAERSNTVQEGDDVGAKCIYRVSEIERPDENSGENPQPVQIRRINARLLLDGDDPSDMEVLPVLRIVHSSGEDVGLPRQDAGYVPPCLVVGGSPVLRDLVRDVGNQVEASRKELVIQITRGGFRVENMRGVQFEQMLRLKTLNRFSARLSHLGQRSVLAPCDVYLEWRELLAELAALYPDRDQYETAPYDHDNPAVAFQDVAGKLRGLLRGAVAPSFMQVPFTREGGMLVAELTDEHLEQPNDYFLGVKTREDPVSLAGLVEDPDQYKLMAKSLGNRAIRGVKLTHERIPPLELPSETGLTYFRLVRGESARMWDRIKEEKMLSICWPGIDSADHKTVLYMTVPAGGEGE